MDKPISVESWGTWRLCPVALCFPLGNGGREATPIAFTLSLSLMPHWCRTVGRTLLLWLQSLEETWSSGFERVSWEILSCHRAAIFGFPIFILKQVPFNSSLLTARVQDKFHQVSIAELGLHDYLGALNLFHRVLVNCVIVEPRF